MDKKDFQFWLVFIFIICVVGLRSQESYAAVEQVPPTVPQKYEVGATGVFGSTSTEAHSTYRIGLYGVAAPAGYYIGPSVIQSNYSSPPNTYWSCTIRYSDGFEGACTYIYKRTSAQCPADPQDGFGGYVFNASSLMCERTVPDAPACTAGDVIQSGFYNVGSVDTAVLPVLACNSGCEAQSSGTVSVTRRQLVGGVYQYFAGPADYVTTGETCEGGDTVPQSIASIDAAGTCAPGQSFVDCATSFL